MIKGTAAFFRWLGTPVRAARTLFPFTRDGRQTLIYLAFALAGPALTLSVLWIMNEAKSRDLNTFGTLAWMVGGCLLIAVSGLAVYVSLRAIKFGKDGLEVSGEGGDVDRALGAREVAAAAVDKAVEIQTEIKP